MWIHTARGCNHQSFVHPACSAAQVPKFMTIRSKILVYVYYLRQDLGVTEGNQKSKDEPLDPGCFSSVLRSVTVLDHAQGVNCEYSIIHTFQETPR